MKKVSKVLIVYSGAIICFGGKTFIIGTINNDNTVDLAPVGEDQKVTGEFETFEII